MCFFLSLIMLVILFLCNFAIPSPGCEATGRWEDGIILDAMESKVTAPPTQPELRVPLVKVCEKQVTRAGQLCFFYPHLV